MSESIICNEKVCFRCGTTKGLHRHHIISGSAFRKKSEKYGLWVYLCVEHHTGDTGVHSLKGMSYNYYLRKIAQERFEMTHTHEEWMKEFKRNYL